jgi:hypothetical protein
VLLAKGASPARKLCSSWQILSVAERAGCAELVLGQPREIKNCSHAMVFFFFSNEASSSSRIPLNASTSVYVLLLAVINCLA